MSQPARRAATYQDVLEAPEHLVAELIDDELYTSPRPAPAHATAVLDLRRIKLHIVVETHKVTIASVPGA